METYNSCSKPPTSELSSWDDMFIWGIHMFIENNSHKIWNISQITDYHGSSFSPNDSHLSWIHFGAITVDGQNIFKPSTHYVEPPQPQINVSARALPKVIFWRFDFFRPLGPMHFRLHEHWNLGARGFYWIEGGWIFRPSTVVTR